MIIELLVHDLVFVALVVHEAPPARYEHDQIEPEHVGHVAFQTHFILQLN